MDTNEFYIGEPDYQSNFWELQNLNDNCAVVAQMGIINQFIDDPISMDDATFLAHQIGAYNPGFGTTPEAVGMLFDQFDIPYHTVENASIEQLASELQQGHRVVVGLDSDQLWDQGPLNDFYNWFCDVFGFDTSTFQPADHAVSVTAVDLSDLDNPMVIINDSGALDGQGKAYPLDKFMDAWQNSDFHYVATSVAPGGGGGPDFDIGQFLGIGTTIATIGMGLDPASASLAGGLVDSLVQNTDWDSILSSL